MKNKRRIHQKIQNKRNKRNTRKKSSFSFGYKPYGLDVKNIKEGWVSKEELKNIPSAMNKLQEKTEEELDEHHKHNLPFNMII